MDYVKELVLSVKKKETNSGYGLQKECEALITHVLKNMLKTPIPILNADIKNKDDSLRFREEGNQNFVMGDDDEAIEKYTMSLAYAVDKESKAIAHANRSAALYRKNLYHECLIDIDTALSLDYPDEKKKKLEERAAKAIECLRQLFLNKDQNMNNLPSNTDQNSNPKSEKENPQIINDFIDGKIALTKDLDSSIKKSINDWLYNNLTIQPRYSDINDMVKDKECPSFSEGVKISYSEKYGRHLIATKNFRAGDIIIVEKPYAYTIYREKSYTHCNHCLAKCYNLIPCPNCPLTLYCSEECKDSSSKMAHSMECRIQSVLSNLLNVDMDKIRILTKITRFLLISTDNGKSINQLRESIKTAELNTDNRTAGFTEDGIFDPNIARSALSLATNLSIRPLTDISAFSCVAALTVILLALETTFFGRKYKPNDIKSLSDNNDVKFCATIIFRACVIESSNSFSIQQEPGVKCGSGLYVGHSLMNHSCTPNTFRHFEGLLMITRALEPIKKGDQLFTCYGTAYQHMARSERKSKMYKDYFFDCDCKACLEDWPTFKEILANHTGSIAKTNKKLVEKLKPYRKKLLTNKYDIEAIKDILDILCGQATMPCEEIVHAIQYLKGYYLGKF